MKTDVEFCGVLYKNKIKAKLSEMPPELLKLTISSRKRNEHLFDYV